MGERVTDHTVTGQSMANDDLMLWHKFKIEYAFRNKVVNGTNLMYTWKFLEDSI